MNLIQQSPKCQVRQTSYLSIVAVAIGNGVLLFHLLLGEGNHSAAKGCDTLGKEEDYH